MGAVRQSDATAGLDPAVGASGVTALDARTDPPVFSADLWPHRSMGRRGFVWVMGVLAAGLSIPLIAVSGAPAAALVLALFCVGALGLVWALFRANFRAARVHETVRIWRDLMMVARIEPDGRILSWRANPYWVRVELTDTKRVARYLTLAGGGRTIELGAFLTPQERVDLAATLEAALRRAAGAERG